MRRAATMLTAALIGLAVAGCSSSAGTGPSSSTTASSTATTGSATATGSSSSSAPAPVGPSGGPVPKGFLPWSVTFVSASEGWLLGTAPCSHAPCTSMLRTRDGAKTWQGIPAPKAALNTPATRTGLRTIRFADERNGWAVGSEVFATHDGGATWHRQTMGTGAGMVVGLETAGGEAYAIRQSCPGACLNQSVVYASKVGSDTWQAISSPLSDVDTGAAQNAIVLHGADWYVPSRGIVYHGHGPNRSTRFTAPCPTIPTIAVADPQHIDAVCAFDGAAGTTSVQLYGTTNGGQTWAKAGGVHQVLSDVEALADNGAGVLLLSATSGACVVYRSADDGKTLLHAVTGCSAGAGSWADLGFTTATQAIAVLPGHEAFISRDAGTTWQPVVVR